MTTEKSLKKLGDDWGTLTSPPTSSAQDFELEVILPSATAALHFAAQLATLPDSSRVGVADVSAALERAAALNASIPKPFLSMSGDTSWPHAIDFVDAFVELANRGFFSAGVAACSAERVERSVINDAGDMRWRIRCRGVDRWAAQALWVGLGCFRREGNPFPEDTVTAFVTEVGAMDAVARPTIPLPTGRIDMEEDVSMDDLRDCDDGLIRFFLTSEPSEVILQEIYHALDLWSHVVPPGFPRYGHFVAAVSDRAALDTRTQISMNLNEFGQIDPRALLTFNNWIAHEGPRLGIVRCRFEF
jgi:hypothetical protein